MRKRLPGEPGTIVTLVSFGFPSESSLTGVEPCRSGFSRPAVQRLPGLSPVRIPRNRVNDSAVPLVDFPASSGLDPRLHRPSGPIRRTGSGRGATSLDFSRPPALVAAEILRDGLTRSRQSPPIAFLRFRRTGPQATSNHLSGLFRPDNAPGLSPSGPCSFQRSGTRLRARSSPAVGHPGRNQNDSAPKGSSLWKAVPAHQAFSA